MEPAKRLFDDYQSFSLWATPSYILNLVISFKLVTNKQSELSPPKATEPEEEGEEGEEVCEGEEKDNNEKNENPFKRINYKTKV